MWKMPCHNRGGSQCTFAAEGRGEYCLNWPTYQPSYSTVMKVAAGSTRATAGTAQTRRGAAATERQVNRRLRDEAAKICADAMLDSGFDAAIRAQLIEITSEKTVEAITKHWSGSRCDELAATARAC